MADASVDCACISAAVLGAEEARQDRFPLSNLKMDVCAALSWPFPLSNAAAGFDRGR